jgi:hypothetical protein
MVQDGALHFRAGKGGKAMTLPIHPRLQTVLEGVPGPTFLINGLERPFTAAGFGNWFRDRCNEAGLEGYSAQGLLTIGANAGLTDRQLMAITGDETTKETSGTPRNGIETCSLQPEWRHSARLHLSHPL